MLLIIAEYFRNLFILHPVGQSIGILWTIVIAIAFLFRSENKFRLGLLIGQCIFVIHFISIGAIPGAIAFSIAALRTVWSTYIRKNKKDYLGFVFLYLLFGYLRMSNWLDVLPLLVGIVTTTSMFFYTGLRGRLFFLAGAVGYFIYDFLIGSIGGMINESLVFFMNMITIVRMLTMKKK